MALKDEFGKRLRQFGEERYGSMAEFARALGISPQQLNGYLNGERIPGNKMRDRLENLGADIYWLVEGKTLEEMKEALKARKSKSEAFVAFHAPAGLSKEMREAMQKIVDGLAELEPGQIDQARRIIKEAFRKKK